MPPLRISGLLIVPIIVAFVSPLLGVLAARKIDDRPVLARELGQLVAFMDATVNATDNGLNVVRPPYSANPALASQIEDRPNAPGYDRCDAWRDWILPGWQASYGYNIDLGDGRDGEDVLRRTTEFWLRQGHAAESITREAVEESGQVFLKLSLEYVTYWLSVDNAVDVASFVGTTDCLPVH